MFDLKKRWVHKAKSRIRAPILTIIDTPRSDNEGHPHYIQIHKFLIELTLLVDEKLMGPLHLRQ